METVVLTNRVALTLARIYQSGFAVNLDKLEEVREEFENEKIATAKRLNLQVKELMGDTPINLNSPEQMSWVIYSRKPKDKTMWTHSFDQYMKDKEFKDIAFNNSDVIYKTNAVKCLTCYGSGSIRKVKKDGKPFAKPSKCDACNSSGYHFMATDKVAGLKFSPPSAKWVTANGYSVNKKYLDILQNTAKKVSMDDAVNFLSDLQRLSALDTYLSSFIQGIKTYVKPDGKLHVRLLQHRTSTGRFSGADPNMQNMPRGGTFPVKKVFVSRWEGGKILEADFAQLKHILLLRYMVRQVLVGQKQRQRTTSTLQKSTKESTYGTPDWLKKL